MHAPARSPLPGRRFYRSAINALQTASVEFLVGGAHAMRVYTGLVRDTKDFDVFVRPEHAGLAMDTFRSAGLAVGLVYTHWLGKVWQGRHFIDVIFRSGNGLCDVDDEWFAHAREAEIVGCRLPVCPPEEIIWQKAFVMERERFDGADIQHLIRACAGTLDWSRLLRRFGEDRRVLLCHLVLTDYIYPGEPRLVPDWVMSELISELTAKRAAPTSRLCRGTLLSRLQYLMDVEQLGYTDARINPEVHMSRQQLREWTLEARRKAAEARPR